MKKKEKQNKKWIGKQMTAVFSHATKIYKYNNEKHADPPLPYPPSTHPWQHN